jgi:hypothetical protein
MTEADWERRSRRGERRDCRGIPAASPGYNPESPHVPPEASALLACAPPARRPAREAINRVEPL